MQKKWQNTEPNVSLYWPDFLALTLKWSPRSLKTPKTIPCSAAYTRLLKKKIVVMAPKEGHLLTKTN